MNPAELMQAVTESQIQAEDIMSRKRLSCILPSHSEAQAQAIILALLNEKKAAFRPPLRPVQVEMYKQVWEAIPDDRIFYLECARRLGKTFFMLAVAFIVANETGRPVWIRYAAPTIKSLREMVMPVYHILVKFLAKPYRPQYLSTAGCYVFPNMSRITFGSCEVPDSIRGSEADFALIDEAGFAPDLEYVLKDVIHPMLLSKPYKEKGFIGKILIGTTPSPKPDHYSNVLAALKEAEGHSYMKRDIYSRTDISEDELQGIIKTCGGVGSPRFQREYLCNRIVDMEAMVIPEFRQHEDQIVSDAIFRRPPRYDAYTVGDIGFDRDLSAVLFAWYDFKNARLVIEDEIVGYRCLTQELGKGIAFKELQQGFGSRVYLRELDTTSLTINHYNSIDFYQDNLPIEFPNSNPLRVGFFSKLPVAPLEPRINKAREWISTGRVVIRPKCKNLILHLKMGSYNKQGKLRRTEEFGHFDALMAFVYLIDRVNQLRNPMSGVTSPGVGPDTHHLRKRSAPGDPDYAWTPESIQKNSLGFDLGLAFSSTNSDLNF